MELPASVEEIDRQLDDYRRILDTMSVAGRVAAWEQVDRLLDLRLEAVRRERRAARAIAKAA